MSYLKGVHLLNHAIRQHFGNENSIIQTSSHVKNTSFRFEFKFNEMLKKPDITDISSIESICAQLIQKSLSIHIEDSVNLSDDNLALNYPLRKLNDILYPRNLRVVSIGTEWKNFNIDHGSQVKFNSDYSAELCCGNYLVNLRRFLLII